MRAGPIALFASLLLASAPALAFHGVVVSPGGTPYAGARVQVLGRPGVAVTDAAGRFRLEPDPTPPFHVLMSRPDGVALRPILVSEIPDGPLELRLEPFLAEEVSVISGSAPDIELPPAAAFSLSGRADLEERAPVQLFQALENVPGAGRVGDGLAAVPSLRGFASSRTLILLDEGRVSAERRAGPSATFLDPATIEEVEVVRGPGAVAYGSDAFGGVIRMRTRIAGFGEPQRVRYHVAAADATGELAGGAEVTTPAFGGGLLLGVSSRKFDDYESPSGEIPVSGGESSSARVGFQHALAGGSLRVLWRTDMASDVGKPAADSAVTRTSYPEERSYRLSVQYDHGPVAGFSRVSLAATGDRYRLLTDREVVPTANVPRRITRADVESDDWGLRIEGERVFGRARLVVGFDGSGRLDLFAANDTISFSSGRPCCEIGTSREVSIGDADRTDLGAFASASGEIGRVGLAGGVRFDSVSSSNAGGYFGDRSESNGAFSGFAAATMPLGGGFSAALQVARGFREPLLSDRYYRGVTGRGFITGNPDLVPETSLQFDGALRFERSGASAALYVFGYRIEELIERYREGNDYFFRNRGASEITGAEFEAAIEVARGVVLSAGLQALRGKVRDDGSPTDDVPPLGGFLVVRHEASERWSWHARVASYARDDRPGPSEKVTPGYAIVDAGVTCRLSPAVEVQVGGRNLLDRAYPASPDVKSVEAPGRTLQLTIRGIV